jgi:hypothetical protein
MRQPHPFGLTRKGAVQQVALPLQQARSLGRRLSPQHQHQQAELLASHLREEVVGVTCMSRATHGW